MRRKIVRILSFIIAFILIFHPINSEAAGIDLTDRTNEKGNGDGFDDWIVLESDKPDSAETRTVGKIYSPNGIDKEIIQMRTPVLSGGIWRQSNGRWWYDLGGGNYPYGGWFIIDGHYYFFDSSGYMCTGWISDAGYWYYCDTTSGIMQTGWLSYNSNWYYLNPVSPNEGAMLTGWYKISGTYEYLRESDGAWISSGSGNTGLEMVRVALSAAGCPYQWGGTDIYNGSDCSGFVMTIHGMYGMTLPHSAMGQYNGSTHISYNDLQMGDIVYYYSSTQQHIAFYAGKVDGNSNQIVHAANSNDGVKVSSMFSTTPTGYGTYWR